MSTSASNAAALAALSVCEAIVLALVEDQEVDRDQIQEMLEDAIEGHLAVAASAPHHQDHRDAARLIERIVISLDAVEPRQRRKG